MLREGEASTAEASDRRRSVLRRFWRGSKGTTAIEYALIVGVLITFIVAAVTSLGDGLDATFNAIIAKLAEALP